MNAAVTIIIALLGNEKLVNLIVGMLEKLIDKPDNAVDKEYVEVLAPSLRERVIDNRVPVDGNVILEQKEIDRVKKRRKKR